MVPCRSRFEFHKNRSAVRMELFKTIKGNVIVVKKMDIHPGKTGRAKIGGILGGK